MISFRDYRDLDFEYVFFHENSAFERMTKESFQRLYLEDDLVKIQIILIKEIIIGYLIIWLDEAKFQLYSIFIQKEFRHQGMAYNALLLLEKQLRKTGVKEASLEVNEHNINAIKLYNKLGYKEVAVRKDYYHNHDNALLMYKKL